MRADTLAEEGGSLSTNNTKPQTLQERVRHMRYTLLDKYGIDADAAVMVDHTGKPWLSIAKYMQGMTWQLNFDVPSIRQFLEDLTDLADEFERLTAELDQQQAAAEVPA